MGCGREGVGPIMLVAEGIFFDTMIVKEGNVNNEMEIVIPLENSVFADIEGKYNLEEANEKLKEYKKY